MKQYLPFYIGAKGEFKCKHPIEDFEDGGIYFLNGRLLDILLTHDRTEFKPFMRSLSDMTEEEMKYWYSLNPFHNEWSYITNGFPHNHLYKPDQFVWLLSKHFDLFNLIKSGHAINKTT